MKLLNVFMRFINPSKDIKWMATASKKEAVQLYKCRLYVHIGTVYKLNKKYRGSMVQGR